jgi:hypothetical protein
MQRQERALFAVNAYLNFFIGLKPTFSGAKVNDIPVTG